MVEGSCLVRFPLDTNDKKPLGNSGEYVPAVGVGTWDIRNAKLAVDALAYAVELGLNLIDTAEMYQSGGAEEIVGSVIRRVGRERVFVVTKLLPERFAARDKAVRAAEASLKRLGISYADLILIHWPLEGVPLKTQIESLEALVERGLTRYIGVSNFDGAILEEAVKSTKKYDIVVDQVKYSVLDKRVEFETLPLCLKNRVTLQAYTPLERGRVAGDKRVARIAEKYGKTCVQAALNYLISRPMVTAIPKSERMERISEFAGALGWRLNTEDLEELETI
jgi:diketogulonate reductase-like aldo/keto reductase